MAEHVGGGVRLTGQTRQVNSSGLRGKLRKKRQKLSTLEPVAIGRSAVQQVPESADYSSAKLSRWPNATGFAGFAGFAGFRIRGKSSAKTC